MATLIPERLSNTIGRWRARRRLHVLRRRARERERQFPDYYRPMTQEEQDTIEAMQRLQRHALYTQTTTTTED